MVDHMDIPREHKRLVKHEGVGAVWEDPVWHLKVCSHTSLCHRFRGARWLFPNVVQCSHPITALQNFDRKFARPWNMQSERERSLRSCGRVG